VSFSIPLTSAVQSGDEQAVSALLANGADVNERTSGGQTALILAVIFGRSNIVRLLVNAGADPQERDNLGLNAIDWAQRRGSTEALELFANTAQPSTPPSRILINLEEPEQSEPEVTPPVVETRESVSEAEKSQRWVTGLKQRLDEQAQRRLNRNEPPPERDEVVPEPEPVEPEPLPLPSPEPSRSAHSSRILTPPADFETVVETGKRKRCPKCNAIYNGDLITYCAIDMEPLVDIDEPIISEAPPPKSNPPLFWIMVVVTLIGSIMLGSLITAYLYRTSQANARTAAEQHRTVVKGSPKLDGELAGKVVSLPEAECPVRSSEPETGTVTVYIIVAKNGQVYKARALGGDWLMRGAATEAAMKSTFDGEKLTARETEGTITYTFKP
jgi:hypothetical protein